MRGMYRRGIGSFRWKLIASNPARAAGCWWPKTTTGAEAPIDCTLYAALKRRSSTVLHALIFATNPSRAAGCGKTLFAGLKTTTGGSPD